MRCLSIQQPWLDLILSGRKTIETRHWQTWHRGPLLLHASRQVDEQACDDFQIPRSTLETGVILGVCDLWDCIPFTRELWPRLHDQAMIGPEFEGGIFAWRLRDVKRFIEPVLYGGQLRLFEVPLFLKDSITALWPDLRRQEWPT